MPTHKHTYSTATNLAYYVHTPRQPLFDVGFAVLPALSPRMQIWSEVMFFTLVATTVMFAVSPFFRINYFMSRNGKTRGKDATYMAHMLSRFLGVLVLAQSLRIVSFMSTSLPGPNYHCRPGSVTYNPPTSAYDIFLRTDAFLGCGDLVFSSHTTFVLLFALTINKYSSVKWLKRVVWLSVVAFAFLCVAARKHYTLDIVVACYTVPLLWIAYDKYFPDHIPPELLSAMEGIEGPAVERGSSFGSTSVVTSVEISPV